jgi:hypothetical protein
VDLVRVPQLSNCTGLATAELQPAAFEPRALPQQSWVAAQPPVYESRWARYFITLIAVVEMMPRQFSRFTGFLGSKVNYIMWWCFLKGMWKAVRGRLGFKKIVFKVTEKKGDAKTKKEAANKSDALLDKDKGSGLTDAEVAVMYGLVDDNGEYDEDAVQALQEQLAEVPDLT